MSKVYQCRVLCKCSYVKENYHGYVLSYSTLQLRGVTSSTKCQKSIKYLTEELGKIWLQNDDNVYKLSGWYSHIPVKMLSRTVMLINVSRALWYDSLCQHIKTFNKCKLKLIKYQNSMKSHLKLNLGCLGLVVYPSKIILLQENSRNSDIYSVIQVLMPGTCYEYNSEQSKQ